jgi:methyl-accepting chemotaxis protein
MGAYTITLPPATQAEIDGLIADLRTVIHEMNTAAQNIGSGIQSMDSDFHTTMTTVDAEISAIQASIQEIADAAKTFKFSGPMGIHGGSA